MNNKTPFTHTCHRFLALLLAVWLAGCTSDRNFAVENVGSEASSEFSALKTYHWNFDGLRDAVPTGGHLPEFNRVVCEHVDQHLAALGYQRVAPEQQADFVMDYRITVEQAEAASDDDAARSLQDLSNVEEVNNYSLRWRFDERNAPHVEAPKDHMVPYQRGTLHLGASNDHGQTIWHYSVSKMLNQRANEAERRAALRIAVDKVMKSFPSKN